MNLKEKYYFFKDDSEGKVTSDLVDLKNKIEQFEKKTNLKITEEHKDFLLTFPVGAFITGMFDNKLVFENCIDIIYSIDKINGLFFGLRKDLYSDAKTLDLIPFASSSGDMECYIGGGEENLGDIYFCENSDYGVENRILICKGFDTFMSGYKKTEGYD